MTVDFAVKTFDVTGAADGEVLAELSPDDGELWYVDYVATASSGGDATSGSPSLYVENVHNGYTISTTTVAENSNDYSGEAAIGIWIGPGQSVQFVTDDPEGTGGDHMTEHHGALHARRVI